MLPTILLCLVLVFFAREEKLYVEQLSESAVTFKENFLKDSVTNFIGDLKRSVDDSVRGFNYTLAGRKDRLVKMLDLDASVEKNLPIIDRYFTQDEDDYMWGYALIADGAVLGSMNFPEGGSDNAASMKKAFCVWEKLAGNGWTLYFGVTAEHLYYTIKGLMAIKIHSSQYVEDTYFWINEVKNWDGGDDFAVRLIHPNPISSEGMSLSTDMQDAKGTYPYQNELEGIKRAGEVFNTYYFKRPDSNQIAKKLTYSKLYEPYNWIISMGVYYDDIYDYLNNTRVMRSYTIMRYAMPMTVGFLFLVLLVLFAQVFREQGKITTLQSRVNWDPLTHANSRDWGKSELEHEFENFCEGQSSPAIMYMDIDNFKGVNDRYGHDAGDKVLAQVSHAFYSCCRVSDKLVRWGGDEFVAIFVGMKESYCMDWAAKFLHTVNQLEVESGAARIRVTVSLGFSYFKKGDKSYQNALTRADEALYKSKQAGKNTASFDR